MSLRIAFAASIALFTSFVPQESFAEEPAAGKSSLTPRVVGYLPSYRIKSFDASIGKYLTELIYFSIEPQETGELNHAEVTTSALAQLHGMRKEHGTRLQIAVGGWGKCRAFAPMALDPERRQRFVQTLLKYCLDNRLDGADFDWEFPKGDRETAAYAALLCETKAAFAPHGLLVTIALSPSQRLSAEAYQAVDCVHLMSYDHSGAEHASFEQAGADIERAIMNGAAAEKLLLGVPFYGRKHGAKPAALAYAQLLETFAPLPEQDLAGGYNFNGPATVRRKARLAIERGLRGVMIWELGQDASGDASLLRALHAETAAKPSK